jgi:hypothetical protein
MSRRVFVLAIPVNTRHVPPCWVGSARALPVDRDRVAAYAACRISSGPDAALVQAV